MEILNLNHLQMSYTDERMTNDTNSTQLPSLIEPNLWCLVLVLFPLTCVFGNVLVVLAVFSERSLQTSTNFLLISLAGADLCIGTLVMPFSIYLTINRLHWYLPEALCNFFCVVDVSASTSSIVHLVAISIDRFYAVVRHMDYKSPKHRRRVYLTIIFCWTFSIGIGLPLGIGLNRGGRPSSSTDEHECGIVNPDYMLYSSIFAFYIPCLVMTIMYSFVFYKLHRRMRAVKLQEMAAGQMVHFGDHLGNILQHAYGNKDNLRQASIIWAIPFLKTLEATIAEDEDMSTEELNELTTILQTLESDPHHHAIIAKSMEGIPESPEASTVHAGTGTADPKVNGSWSQGQVNGSVPRNDWIKEPKVNGLHSAKGTTPYRQSRLTTVFYSMATTARKRRRRNRLRNKTNTGTKPNSSSSRLASILASFSDKSNTRSDPNTETNEHNDGSGKSGSDSERRRRQSLFLARQKIRTLKARSINLLMKLKSKQGMAIRKETRATKLVCAVMLVFLLCWMPFFTLNIVKVSNLRAGTWTYELESLFIFFTWLGYLNSCLNPIIYSLFNRKFRATFKKLLRCLSDSDQDPLRRRRRLYSRPFVGTVTDDKRPWLPMVRRLSITPRKNGMQPLVSPMDDTTTPRNDFSNLSPLLPQHLENAVSVADADGTLSQRKITWKHELTKIDEASDVKSSEAMNDHCTVAVVRKDTVAVDPLSLHATVPSPRVTVPSLSPRHTVAPDSLHYTLSPPDTLSLLSPCDPLSAIDRNDIDMATLRRIQNSRFHEKHIHETLDFTEPVEV